MLGIQSLMFNSKEKISASEINKYLYCNYQWYYGRKYGSKKLMEERRQMLEELGYEDSTKSNFVDGSTFHESHYRNVLLRKKIIKLILFLIIICVAYFFIKQWCLNDGRL